eukprot:TRINITY_DN20347_c0_g1_i1.p1 TRINITY_DN20347_c0_g1~~TRINITY_DN20347_c0_g1_i1.p1  ORF type:complete len:289 (+),score=71.51 TRINITY_DN20347_c0_g1_i1:65-868(+)
MFAGRPRGCRFYHAVAVDHRGAKALRARTINVAVISKADVERAAREAVEEQARAASLALWRQQEQMREEQAREEQLVLERREKINSVAQGAFALASALVVGVTWVYSAAAAKDCEVAVAAALADSDKAIATAEHAIHKAKHTWTERMAPLENRVRNLEAETTSQTTKIEGLTSALRASLVATGLWRWRQSAAPILPSQPIHSEIVSAGGALVRNGADPSSEQVARLPAGTAVTIDQQVGRRVHISAPCEGWLSTHTASGLSIIRGYP